MQYPKIPSAQTIIEICYAKGIKNIVISPGSRNAPLTIGFVNNTFFKCYSIVDERCAGFFALGMAQQIQKPVVLVCTSGSALLNYYPAIAEAFYSQIPLIVISADRPFDKIDIGDGQAIRQRNVFENHSLLNVNLSEILTSQDSLNICDAIDKAIQSKGPVHINVPFEEPLYETVNELTIDKNYIVSNHFLIPNQEADLEKYVSVWNKSSKKLILVGECFPNSLDQEINDILGTDSSIVVMTETTSNLHHKNFINNIDTIITPFSEADYKEFQPDILITFGGMIVSKRIKAMLRKYQPAHHWHIDSLRAYNTFGCLTNHFQENPNDFFRRFLPSTTKINSDYNQKIQTLKAFRLQKHINYLANIPFCDFKAFEQVIQSLPKKSMLQLSNSSTVRYAQLIDIESTISVFCNRGTSGIDGSTSTAVGAAVASKQQTILITGDISFFYDSNGLWNNYIPQNFKIILINNGGGGIFRILPGHDETPVFNTFFETSHCLTAENLAKMYQFDYHFASSVESLQSKLNDFYLIEHPAILEIFTPTQINNYILLDYFKNLS
jgi:2-succinyl-5-enolpyruvyl-6-hydroxy-3-cyclohexene-1-carboxylate synthase